MFMERKPALLPKSGDRNTDGGGTAQCRCVPSLTSRNGHTVKATAVTKVGSGAERSLASFIVNHRKRKLHFSNATIPRQSHPEFGRSLKLIARTLRNQSMPPRGRLHLKQKRRTRCKLSTVTDVNDVSSTCLLKESCQLNLVSCRRK